MHCQKYTLNYFFRKEIDTACGFQENVNENFKSLRQSALGSSGQLVGKTSKVITANGLFYDKPVKLVTEFANIANDYYQTETRAVDFHTTPETARKQINEWVNNKTEGMITQILSRKDVPKTTQLVITNTLFFNGSWESGFDPKLTRSRPFIISDKKQIQIPTMYQKNNFSFRLPYRNQFRLPLSAQPNVIEIPYVGGSHRMIMLVSNEHITLEEIEKNLPTKYFKWRNNLSKDKLTLLMPKFQIDYQTDLIFPLRQMGINKAFQKSRANFQNMTHDRISFSKFLHRSKLIVDEFGTQAASSSALLGVLRMAQSRRSITFDVNRPFVFVIEDKKTGVHLFTGRITDPRSLT